MKPVRLLLLPLLLSELALGSHVAKVAEDQNTALITVPDKGRWNLNDYVCAIKDKVEVACGYILMSTGRGASVQWDFRPKKIEAGLEVAAATDAQKKKHATTWGFDEKWNEWDETTTLFNELAPFRDTDKADQKDMSMDDREEKPKEEKKVATSEKEKTPVPSPTASPVAGSSPSPSPAAGAPAQATPAPVPSPILKPAPLLPAPDTK